VSNHVNNKLQVAGPEPDVRRLKALIAKGGGSPQPCDFSSFVPATTQESKTRWLTDDAMIEDPDKRPLVIFFESLLVPPDALVKKLSLLFPTLVFGLRFVESWDNYLGWIVFHNGNECGSGWNNDINRFGNHSGSECRDRESLNPDGAMIDSHNAVDWEERFREARNALPTRKVAESLGVSDQLAECEEMMPRVMDSAPEYMDAPIPHGPVPISLNEFCGRVSHCEMAVQYRSRMTEVLASAASAEAMQDATNKITDNDPETVTSARGQPMQQALAAGVPTDQPSDASRTKLVRIRVDAHEEIVLKSLLDIEVPIDASAEEVEGALEDATQDPDIFEIVNWDWDNRGTNDFEAFAHFVIEHPKEYGATPDVTLVRDQSGSLVVTTPAAACDTYPSAPHPTDAGHGRPASAPTTVNDTKEHDHEETR
jgi:hypothetical protein